MIDGTNLNQLTGSRQLLRAFGGINETYSCSEAELSAALNFSGRGFPALQTRALRKKVRDVEKVNGMYHLNGLLICRGTRDTRWPVQATRSRRARRTGSCF